MSANAPPGADTRSTSRIASVQVRAVQLGNRTLATAYGPSVDVRTHVFVAVHDDVGRRGVGEGSPLTNFTGEHPTEMLPILERRLGPALLGVDPFDLDTVHERLDGAMARNTTSKAALVNAVLDLQGRATERSIGALLGHPVRDSVDTVGVVGLLPVGPTIARACSLHESGFRTVKLKVGHHVDRDVEVVTEVRRALGPDVAIRADANGGYVREDALRFLRGVASCELQYLEQPLPASEPDGLASLRRSTSVPIAADESLATVEDAERLARSGGADVFVIKLIKSGGLVRAQRIVAIAEAAGLTCVCVSPYETAIGASFHVHLAASSACFRLASEVGPGVSVVDLPGADGLVYTPGSVRVPTGHGCGVSIPEGLFGG